MFKTILESIQNLPCISFEEYFTRYIFSVQDTNIDEEIRFMLNNNFLDIKALNSVILQDEERLSW